MIRGSCLCGDVTWSLEGAPLELWTCACQACRRESGALFAAWLDVPEAALAWTAGEAGVRRFESSPGFERAFCGRCGGKVPRRPGDGLVRVPAGALDDDPGLRAPSARRFAAAPAHATSPWTDASCLCGAFPFALAGREHTIKACHCSRDRKMSGSAHDACLLAARDQVLPGRAGGSLRFGVPGATRFVTSFCPGCGGPALTDEVLAGAASGLCVPAGCLHEDVGARLRFHIFWESRAPWFDEDDGLPRFAAYPPAGFRAERGAEPPTR